MFGLAKGRPGCSRRLVAVETRGRSGGRQGKKQENWDAQEERRFSVSLNIWGSFPRGEGARRQTALRMELAALGERIPLQDPCSWQPFSSRLSKLSLHYQPRRQRIVRASATAEQLLQLPERLALHLSGLYTSSSDFQQLFRATKDVKRLFGFVQPVEGLDVAVSEG